MCGNAVDGSGPFVVVEPGRQTERGEDVEIPVHGVPADAVGGDREDLQRAQLVAVVDAAVGGESGLAIGFDPP